MAAPASPAFKPPAPVMIIVTSDATLRGQIAALIQARGKLHEASLTSVTTSTDATLPENINALVNGSIGKALSSVLAASLQLKAQAAAIITTPPAKPAA